MFGNSLSSVYLRCVSVCNQTFALKMFVCEMIVRLLVSNYFWFTQSSDEMARVFLTRV